MKFINTIILFLIMSFTGCSSSVKFSAEEKTDKKNGSQNRFEGENKKEEKTEELPFKPVENDKVSLPPVPVSDDIILESSTGVASFYANKFHGRKTANGEKYNKNDYTAAHSKYPFNTIVKITNLANNKSVKVRINDRKPSLHGRLIDVSYAAAKDLEFITNGIAKVQVDVISWGDSPVK